MTPILRAPQHPVTEPAAEVPEPGIAAPAVRPTATAATPARTPPPAAARPISPAPQAVSPPAAVTAAPLIEIVPAPVPGPRPSEADRLSTDADRALVQAIRADVARTYEFDKKLLETLVKDCDWGLAWRRVQRMKAVFAGTEYEAKANADVARLEANPVVAYVRPAQDQYDALIDQYAKARTKKDVESLLTAVRNFADRYVNTKPGDRAAQWIPAIEKRLAELSTN